MPSVGSVGNTAHAAPFGGRRRSHKKLRLVKKKTVRRMLAAKGLKMRGGEAGGGPTPATGSQASSGAAPTMGGRRGKSHRRRKSLFGMRF
jgi:hypothetical protein